MHPILSIRSTGKWPFGTSIICPPLAKVLINTYREDINYRRRSLTLQGQPKVITCYGAIYTIAITPLIHHLEVEGMTQVWFADQ